MVYKLVFSILDEKYYQWEFETIKNYINILNSNRN